ncbi:MAG: hypothetical protein AAGA56_05970, partial [Myxococcota bacterium]
MRGACVGGLTAWVCLASVGAAQPRPGGVVDPEPRPAPGYPATSAPGPGSGSPGYPPPAVFTSPLPEDQRHPVTSFARPVRWFARVSLGLGSAGVQANNDALRDLGFNDVRSWFGVDGAWMVHPRVGVGAYFGFNRHTSGDEEVAASLNEWAVYGGVQAPIRLYGPRLLSVLFVPRVGLLG